ncbi:MAG: hypothetical protein BWY79_02200 [Actinobacteria bacterium ADurb.Bin444]|nr:MAG: hypothetical protein BWY79_02200 [Actinobacteria bacterium ADurb.Bin444]
MERLEHLVDLVGVPSAAHERALLDKDRGQAVLLVDGDHPVVLLELDVVLFGVYAEEAHHGRLLGAGGEGGE